MAVIDRLQTSIHGRKISIYCCSIPSNQPNQDRTLRAFRFSFGLLHRPSSTDGARPETEGGRLASVINAGLRPSDSISARLVVERSYAASSLVSMAAGSIDDGGGAQRTAKQQLIINQGLNIDRFIRTDRSGQRFPSRRRRQRRKSTLIENFLQSAGAAPRGCMPTF